MKLHLQQKVVNSTCQEKPFVQVEGELTPSGIEGDRPVINLEKTGIPLLL